MEASVGTSPGQLHTESIPSGGAKGIEKVRCFRERWRRFDCGFVVTFRSEAAVVTGICLRATALQPGECGIGLMKRTGVSGIAVNETGRVHGIAN